MHLLKADTSVKVVVGPFVDVGDGFTPETGVTLGAADIAELVKHDASGGTDISGRTFGVLATTAVDGYYNLTLTSGDTDTEGMLTIAIQDNSVFLPVRYTAMVVNAGAYELLCGTAGESENLRASASGIVTGAAETGTLSTTQMTSNLAEATDDHYNGRIVVWTSGVLAGQASDITDYLGSTGMLTYTAVTEAPSNTDTFVIV